jgi:hypothetical protein
MPKIIKCKKKYLIPLTLDIVRDHFWDKTTKKGKKIYHRTIQDFDNNYKNDDETFQLNEIFIPNGQLHEEKVSYSDTKKFSRSIKTITKLKDWLSNSKNGPYTKKNKTENKKQLPFYFLDGDLTFDKGTEWEHFGIQICSSPLNSLMGNCLSGTFVYIDKRQLK